MVQYVNGIRINFVCGDTECKIKKGDCVNCEKSVMMISGDAKKKVIEIINCNGLKNSKIINLIK